MSTIVTPLTPTAGAPSRPDPGAPGVPAAAADAPTAPGRGRGRRRRGRGGLWWLRWLSPILLIVVWQIAGATGILPERILPAPQLIAESAIELLRSGELVDALAVSSVRVAQGFALGAVAGLVLGVIVGTSRYADAILDPPLQMLRALPHLGLIPLFILWFGIGEAPKVLLIALGVVFPIYLNTASGLRQIDPKLRDMATVFGFSRRQRLTEVILPSIAPQVLVGVRQSLAIAWLTLIVAEQLNATTGLGYLIMNARDYFRIDVIIVGLVVYALLGILTDALVRVAEARALRHYR
ncbi:ABC transporter permease [Dietzia cinnamea]|uniref:ABC transporter permease n=2 Tax=Dietzia TaxID=37914 RepID=A0AAW5QCS5_9ACTN|nr:ABC transporter permease [Dietzia cinnamea]MCT1640911.1 ABC transporter permease [Dietzia cinnamea]MCT1865142.1 ABC transporter permease [Dietzia cinnamea]MCT1886035.1 ABC transporter permease [Dietzia cinnamea]MCT2030995.1 ABC transporter permease [Dietzia cinnamea]MCT2034513.1 ABC transporter permease [Dietzia cinnamea]